MIDVRNRLVKALHTTTSLPALREELVLVLCDLEEAQAAPTQRNVTPTDAPPDAEPESAPPTPADSERGMEYGI